LFVPLHYFVPVYFFVCVRVCVCASRDFILSEWNFLFWVTNGSEHGRRVPHRMRLPPSLTSSCHALSRSLSLSLVRHHHRRLLSCSEFSVLHLSIFYCEFRPLPNLDLCPWLCWLPLDVVGIPLICSSPCLRNQDGKRKRRWNKWKWKGEGEKRVRKKGKWGERPVVESKTWSMCANGKSKKIRKPHRRSETLWCGIRFISNYLHVP